AQGRGAQGLYADRWRLTDDRRQATGNRTPSAVRCRPSSRYRIALPFYRRLHSLVIGEWNIGSKYLMSIKQSLVLVGAAALAFSWTAGSANAQGVFQITSSSFKDGERFPTKMAGNNKQNPNCVGENVSPALSWANPPAGTKSYALLMFDPEGRPPGGVSHWVA